MFRHESCPECGSSHTEVIESRLCTNGTRRRRHACRHCGKRWTAWDGARPSLSEIGKTKARRPMRRQVTPLTAEQVREALLARDVSHTAMGRRLGRSGEAIRQLRIGATHGNFHPEIARWQPMPALASVATISGPNCFACAHWNDRCAFGFPDPLEEGPGFAADCDLYAA